MKNYLPEIGVTAALIFAALSDVYRDAVPVLNAVYWVFAFVGCAFLLWSLVEKAMTLLNKMEASYYTAIVTGITLLLCVMFAVRQIAARF